LQLFARSFNVKTIQNAIFINLQIKYLITIERVNWKS
jgi:hypothetical protein